MATSGRKLTEQERQRIVRLRANGMTIRQLAAHEGVSTRTVQRYLRTKRSSLQITGLDDV